MTLCLAWRLGRNVAFATDSVVGTTAGQKFDVAIKLFAIPVFVRSSSDEKSGISTVMYSHTIALSCSAENAAAAAVFKDAFASVCSNLQWADSRPNVSFKEIVQLAARIYEKVGQKAREGFQIIGLPDVLMGGWCDEERKLRVFKLIAPDERTVKPIISERLTEPGPFDFEAIGSGKSTYCDIVEESILGTKPDSTKMLVWFKGLIDSNAVPSVGGTIQYGEFENGDFRIKGIMYPPNAGSNSGMRFIRGTLNISDLVYDPSGLGLQITGEYVHPFIDELLPQ